jgi:hypothetical protein
LRHFASTALAILIGQIAVAAPTSPTNVVARRIDTDAVVIDGNAADRVWAHTVPREGFTQREPHEGVAPTSPTRVSVAYDDEALYVLVEAFDDQPEKIVGRRTRRDEPSTSDWIHLYIATTSGDDRFAYRFSVNAAKVKQDARIIDGVTEDLAYNAIWDAAVTRHPHGWTVEYKIAFHQLAYSTNPHFRFQVTRYQARTGELSTLFPYPRNATLPVAYMRPLTGLHGLPNPVYAELTPYGSLVWQSPNWARSPQVHIGGDFKLTLSPEVNLQATLLPDFGQVEADPSELNLSVFETYLSERRSFFLDGAETLDFGLRQGVTTDKLFYTRRIGQPPRIDPSIDPEDVIEYPKHTPIIGATKLTVRSSRGYTLSLLQATTNQTYALIKDGTERKRVLVAPISQYAIARGTQTFNDGKTNVGAAVTTVSRELGNGMYDELAKNATTTGMDLEHRSGDARLTMKGFTSRIEGSPSSILKIKKNSVHYFQRPDASHLALSPNRTVLDGYGFTVVGSKFSGAPWRASLGGTVISPGFDPNDLGFLQKADDIYAFIYLQYLVNQPTILLRSYAFDANAWTNYDFGGNVTSRAIALSANFVTKDTSTTRLQIQRDTERLDPRVLRGNSAMRIPGKYSASLSATTNDRKAVALDIAAWGGYNDGNVAYWVGGNAALRIRPLSYVQFSIGPYYQHSFDGYAFVDDGTNGNAIVAKMPRDLVSVTVRATVAFSPDLSLQFYTMPYLTAGQRLNFAEVVAPKSVRFSEHFSPTNYSGDNKFWFAESRTNAVLRWEYSPGSAAFIVWSREQSATSNARGSLDFTKDLERLWSSYAIDTLLIKLTYWSSI